MRLWAEEAKPPARCHFGVAKFRDQSLKSDPPHKSFFLTLCLLKKVVSLLEHCVASHKSSILRGLDAKVPHIHSDDDNDGDADDDILRVQHHLR